jgi:hypothetical protein
VPPTSRDAANSSREASSSSPPGADACLLKSVLHNWDDERALAILSACRRAMKPDARLFVVERIVPERLGPSARDREIARCDLQMLLGCDGRERTEAEYDRLLHAAELRRTAVVALDREFSALEARPA